MTDMISTGLLLLAVGMGTVLCVLGIVVATGNLLINGVNRLYPAISENAIQHAGQTSGAKIAAITAAIDNVTAGKGIITNIESLDE